MKEANLDPTEIAKFESLANRWWDKNSEFKPLHEINPLRLNFIDERAKLSGKTVLDIGCGGGILAESMSQRGAAVTGIDMAETSLAIAKIHGIESGIHVDYQQITAEELASNPQNHQQFDIITCLEMLEHVPDPKQIIQACSKLVKPSGHVFFSTINRNPKSYLFAIIGAEHILKLLPKGTHDYQKFIKPSELTKWIRATEFQFQEITGMTYNPITRHYRLNPNDIDVNYLIHATKPNQT